MPQFIFGQTTIDTDKGTLTCADVCFDIASLKVDSYNGDITEFYLFGDAEVIWPQ